MYTSLSLCGALALAVAARCAPATGASTNPVVDLGVTVHQGSLNATGGYYNFSNIPYAEPPVGALSGSPTQDYRQQDPSGAWLGISVPFMLSEISAGTAGSNSTGSLAPASTPDPRENEDCLLLDVIAPKTAFDNKATKKVPVLVWIHGGGYTAGSKNDNNPAGLVAQGMRDGKAGFVYVGINYRLGLFGFPPSNGASDKYSVVTNAGLYDQRLALRWIQKNIHLFGGDADAVTVMGESAGAGSVTFQMMTTMSDGSSSYNSKRTPFNKAIIQSPATRPAADAALYAQVYRQFLATANVTSMEQARSLSSVQLAQINGQMVANSAFASFTFGPNVDGQFITEIPSVGLAAGHIDRSVDTIVAHNLQEGLLFTDPRVQNQTAFKAFMTNLMPTVADAKIEYLVNNIYPEPGTAAAAGLPYTTQTQRLSLAIAEGAITCNAFGVDLAMLNKTRSYQFSVYPGIHAQDVGYTFFNKDGSDSASGFGLSRTIAKAMQNIFADFAMVGATGAGSAASQVPVFTNAANMLNITNSGMQVVTDPAANATCRYWLTGLFS
ncbi:carboxylesterase family protein-like protein [Diplogelasinospora grovesii]|uniref:Carboxylic ester hydrolase n=1 Tax=Diplogelasinospora grovesii TaxID=303347 RepID=A0AAN6S172_9PEZI|nr:carboxylesterase family protein-like protein [Diplogelasinospora grovesii]